MYQKKGKTDATTFMQRPSSRWHPAPFWHLCEAHALRAGAKKGQKATIRANQLYPEFTVNSDGNAKKWDVWGGEACIERTNSQDAAEAALLRLGLAYSVLPSPVFEKRKEEVKQWAS